MDQFQPQLILNPDIQFKGNSPTTVGQTNLKCQSEVLMSVVRSNTWFTDRGTRVNNTYQCQESEGPDSINETLKLNTNILTLTTLQWPWCTEHSTQASLVWLCLPTCHLRSCNHCLKKLFLEVHKCCEIMIPSSNGK